MKMLRKQRRRFFRITFLCIAAFFLFCAALTGCGDRRVQFLAEESRAQESAGDAGDNEKNPEKDAGSKPAEQNKDRQEKQKKQKQQKQTKQKQTKQKQSKQQKQKKQKKEPAAKPAEIYVDVCGAVAAPGVFRMAEGSRVFQAVEAAGGYLPEAARQYVNGAGVLEDGQQIYVPAAEETKSMVFPGEGGVPGGNTPAEAGEQRVNLNTADAEQLMTLTGIGAAKAAAILAYREAHGAFASIEEIMNVQGIKENTFQKIKDDIAVG